MKKRISIFLLLSLFLLALPYIAMRNERVNKCILDHLVQSVSKTTNQQITINKIELDFPLRIRAYRIYADKIAIGAVEAEISPIQLLRGNLSFSNLSIKDVKIESDFSLQLESKGDKSYFHQIKIRDCEIQNLAYGGSIIDAKVKLDYKKREERLNAEIDCLCPKISDNPITCIIDAYLGGSSPKADLAFFQSDNSLFATWTSTFDASFTFNIKGGRIGPFIPRGILSVDRNYSLDGTRFSLQCGAHSIHPALDGDLDIECLPTGSIYNPALNATCKADQIKFHEIATQNVHGNINCVIVDGTVRAMIVAESLFKQQKSLIKGSFDWNGEHLKIANFAAEYFPLSLYANLDYTPKDKKVTGEIYGRISQNEIITPTTGTLSFQARLSKDADCNQRINLHLNGSSLEHARVKIDKLSLSADATSSNLIEGKFLKTDLSLDLNAVSLMGHNIRQALLETHFEDLCHKRNFDIQIQKESGDKLTACGSWIVEENSLILKNQTLEGSFAVNDFKTTEPFSSKLTINKSKIEIKEIQIPSFILEVKNAAGSQNGTIQTSLQANFEEANFENLNLSSAFSNIPVGFFSPLIPYLSPSAKAQGAIRLHGKPFNPSLELGIKLEGAKFAEERLAVLPDFDGDIIISLSDALLTSTGSLKFENKLPITFRASLPLALTLFPFELAFLKNQPFIVESNAQGEISPLTKLFLSKNANAAGLFQLDLKISGELNKPRIKGEGSIGEGVYESPETGSFFRNVSAKLEIDDAKFSFKEIKANDAKSGSIFGDGFFLMDPIHHFPFQFNLDIEKYNLLQLDFASANGNGKVELKGDLSEAVLQGSIYADEIEVRIPEKSQTLLPDVAITYINQPEDEPPPTSYAKSETVWPLILNLDIETLKPFSITGKDLSSIWKGKLKVEGTSAAPQIFGEIKLKEGQYNLQGKSFDLREGTITFNGEPGKKTTIYVIASQELEKIRADIILKGSLNSPVISLRSNPPLSEQEILSWILFGHGSLELTPSQQIRPGHSLAELSANSSANPNILERFREKIGIDKIDINRGSNGNSNEVSLKVGKYISRGVMVSIDKSINSEVNRLSIEAKLIEDFKVRAEIGDDAEGELQVKWKKDY